MTFATEIAKRRTTRATLVRLNPGRYISADLGSEGAGIYSMANTLIISAIKRNGTALTADTTDPTVNDHYYFNETTGEITVKLASAPNGTTNVVIAYYYLFYTSGFDTVYYQTPTDSATTKRFWQPKLLDSSNFNSSIDGLEVGVVSIPDASVDIENSDGEFENYLSQNDSFSNKTIDIWHEINGNFRKAYQGVITSLQINNKYASISFSDQFTLFNNSAFMGDTFSECYYSSATIPIKDMFKPIVLHMAEQTKHDISSYYITDVAGYENVMRNGLSAVCSSYTTTISNSTNRTWTLCRAMTGGVQDQTAATIQAAVDFGASDYVVRVDDTTGFYAGDTFSWDQGGTTYYALILGVGTFTYLTISYNLYLTSLVDYTPTISAASTINALPAVGILYVDSDGSFNYPMQGRDFTVSSTATTGSNSLVKIAFQNAAETSFGALADMNPIDIDIQYKVSCSPIVLGHGNTLYNIVTKSGCTGTYSSFYAADLAVSQDVSFSIPMTGESDYSPYLTYIQKILESMLGYLSQDSSNGISYNLLALPSPAVTRDGNSISENDASYTVEYRDIITQLVCSNAHIPVTSIVGPTGGTTSSAKSQYLHDTIKKYSLEHVLKIATDGTIARQDEILALRSNRKLLISFDTETIDMDTIVGDELTIEADVIPGGSADAFVTSVSKSENKTAVSGTDLLGL